MTPKASQPVALVESAKTAIIMTGFYPDYIWMATNGSANLNSTILKPLLHRNIILYSDLGQFEKWNIKSNELQKQSFKITTSNLLEETATPEDHISGLDIADYFIQNTLFSSAKQLTNDAPSPSEEPMTAKGLMINDLHSKPPCNPKYCNTSPHFQIQKRPSPKKIPSSIHLRPGTQLSFTWSIPLT